MVGSRTLASAVDLPLLARFYDEVYLPAFAHQREPREVWEAGLVAPAACRRFITLAGAGLDDAATARIDGGVTCEWYPRSRCGLLTYLVVAPGRSASTATATPPATSSSRWCHSAAQRSATRAPIAATTAPSSRSPSGSAPSVTA